MKKDCFRWTLLFTVNTLKNTEILKYLIHVMKTNKKKFR